MSLIKTLIHMLGGGDNDDSDDVDTSILRNDIIKKSGSLMSLDVPLNEDDFFESEYVLNKHQLLTFVQAWFLAKYENQVCPFLSMKYTVTSQSQPGKLEAKLKYQTLSDLVKLIKTCNKRFVLISLGIYDQQSGHANVLVIDQRSRTVERYEPHHLSDYDRDSWYPAQYLDDALSKFFHEQLDLTYFAPLDYCAAIPGLQTSFDYSKEGWCFVFAYIYAEYRIKNPDLDREQVVAKLYNKFSRLQKSGKFKQYLDSYVKNIQNFIEEVIRTQYPTLRYSPFMEHPNSPFIKSRLWTAAEDARFKGEAQQLRLTLPETISRKSKRDKFVYPPDPFEAFSQPPDRPAPLPPKSVVGPPARPAPSPPKVVQSQPIRRLENIVADIADLGVKLVLNDKNKSREDRKDWAELFKGFKRKRRELSEQDMGMLLDLVLFVRFPEDIATELVEAALEDYPEVVRKRLGNDHCIARMLYYNTQEIEE